MPKEQEQKLKLIAAKLAKAGKLKRKKGDSLEVAQNKFIYGIMRKGGWKPSREKQ
jgi:hypothetical protein